MDAHVAAAAIALVGAVVIASVPLLLRSGMYVWYRRWVEILSSAQTERQRAIAQERIDYYVVELAVIDRTRRDRQMGGIAGLIVIALGYGVAVVGLVTVDRIMWVGWTLIAVGVVLYVSGVLFLSGWGDRRRSRAREAIKRMRESSDPDSEGLSSLNLQKSMDRLSKLMSTLSNLLKKASETAQGITQNIK